LRRSMLRRTAAICRPAAAAIVQYAQQLGADLARRNRNKR